MDKKVTDLSPEDSDEMVALIRTIHHLLQMTETDCQQDLGVLGILLAKQYAHMIEDHDMDDSKPMFMVVDGISIRVLRAEQDKEVKEALEESGIAEEAGVVTERTMH